MATEVGKAFVPVTFDHNQIGRGLSSAMAQGGRAAEHSVTSVFKRYVGIGTAMFAGAKIFGFVGDALSEGREANRVAAQTAAVIKSTGGAANLTAKEFSSLAESIAMKTGIDDEQIQSASNLLATFTNVRNEVGKGNDIFSQATQTAVDMGAALGGDASSNAIALGKALNDPIRGVTALRRVGVQFTAAQEAQIKSMVTAGDTMGAQKVILAELSKEFGGSAEAQATAGAKFSVFWSNIKEQLGQTVLPLLDRLATWAMVTLPMAFGKVQTAFRAVMTVIEPMARFVKANLVPVLVGLGAAILAAIPVFIAWASVSWAAAGAQIALWAPILAVVAGVGLLVGALVWAYQHVDAFRAIVDTVAGFFTDIFWPLLKSFAGFLKDVFAWYWSNYVTPAVQGVIDVLSWLWTWVLVPLWNNVLKPLGTFLANTFAAAWDAATVAIDFIRDAFSTFGDIASDVYRNTLAPIVESLGKIIELAGKAKEALPGGGGGREWYDIPNPLAPWTWASGGWVPGAPGTPVPGVVHGGEYVLSADMLAGRQPIGVDLAGLRSSVGTITSDISGSRGGDTYNVTVNNPIPEPSPASIHRELRRASYLLGVS